MLRSLRSLRTPVVVLLMFAQTALAQQGRSGGPLPHASPRLGGHTMGSSRYPVLPVSHQQFLNVGPASNGGQGGPMPFADHPAAPQQFFLQPASNDLLSGQAFPSTTNPPPASSNGGFTPSPVVETAPDARWSFNFQNAPWHVVLRTFAKEAGYTLQMATDPVGYFTYFDDNRYAVTEILDVFNDSLMATGQILVRDGNRLTLTNATADIPGNLIPFVPIQRIDTLGRNELASVAIPLRNADVNQAVEEIRELQSPIGQVKALSNSGRVIVTDTGSYLRRMRDLLLGSGVAAGDGQAYVYQLKHAQADDVAKALTEFLNQNGMAATDGTNGSLGGGSSDLSQRVVAEKTTNSLLVRGTTEEMGTIQRIIEELDRAPREVLVQALLVEVELGNTNELGVELGFQDSVLFDRSVVDNLVTISQTTTAPNGTQTTNQNIVSRTAAPGFNFNNQPLGNNVAANPSRIGSQNLSNFGVGRINGDLGFGGLVLSAGSESVNVLLRALDAHFNIDVLSRPQIRAVENHQAFIQIGQQVPVVDGVAITPVGTANPVIRQDQAGIILKVTPRISPDGRVQMHVNAEKSAFNLAPGTGVPIFTDATNGNVIEAPIKDITTADTTVSIQSGQTIVLGGMITNDQTVVVRKVPWLGDIPIIGRLFRYDLNRHKRKELLVFLTPTVLEGAGHSEYIKSKESGLIQMPAEAFSFGDNLTGHYSNPTIELNPASQDPEQFSAPGQPNENNSPPADGQWPAPTVPSATMGNSTQPMAGHAVGAGHAGGIHNASQVRTATGGQDSGRYRNANAGSPPVRVVSHESTEAAPRKDSSLWGRSPNFRGYFSGRKPTPKPGTNGNP